MILLEKLIASRKARNVSRNTKKTDRNMGVYEDNFYAIVYENHEEVGE